MRNEPNAKIGASDALDLTPHGKTHPRVEGPREQNRTQGSLTSDLEHHQKAFSPAGKAKIERANVLQDSINTTSTSGIMPTRGEMNASEGSPEHTMAKARLAGHYNDRRGTLRY